MPEVTKSHRLAVARAWAGEDSFAPFVKSWVEDGTGVRDQFKPVIETLERLAQLVADAEGAWMSTKERPLQVGEERLMAMQILQNGEPRWYMFVATPDDDDEWTQDGEEPGWPPSEVEFSRPLSPPVTPVAELKGREE